MITAEHVSTLVVEWIEIKMLGMLSWSRLSPPSWWSGLKLSDF